MSMISWLRLLVVRAKRPLPILDLHAWTIFSLHYTAKFLLPCLSTRISPLPSSHLLSFPHISNPFQLNAEHSLTLPGATTGSIRNRISALRVKQRDLYESLGWDLPSGGAGHSTKKTPSKPSKSTTATPKSTGKSSGKRNFVVGSDDEDSDAGMGVETPSKKPRKVTVNEGKKGLGLKREVKREYDYDYGSEEEVVGAEVHTPKGYYGLGDDEEDY